MLLLLRLLLLLPLAAAVAAKTHKPIDPLLRLQLLHQLQLQLQQQELFKQLWQSNPADPAGTARIVPPLSHTQQQQQQQQKQRQQQQQQQLKQQQQQQQVKLLVQQLRSQGLLPFSRGARRRRLQGLEGLEAWFRPQQQQQQKKKNKQQQQQQQDAAVSTWLPLLSPPALAMPPLGAPLTAGGPAAAGPLFGQPLQQMQQGPLLLQPQKQQQQQRRRQKQQQEQQQQRVKQQQWQQQHRVLQQIKQQQMKQQKQPERDLVEEETLNLLQSLQHLAGGGRSSSSSRSSKASSSRGKKSSKTKGSSKASSSTLSSPELPLLFSLGRMARAATTTSTTTASPLPPPLDLSAAARGSKLLSLALDFGGALVQVIMKVPELFAALEELAAIFLPLAGEGGGPPTHIDLGADRQQQQQRGGLAAAADSSHAAGSSSADVRNAAAAALKVVEFFAEVEKTLQLAGDLQQQLRQLLQQQTPNAENQEAAAALIALPNLLSQQQQQQRRKRSSRTMLLPLQQTQQQQKKQQKKQQQQKQQQKPGDAATQQQGAGEKPAAAETPEQAAAQSVLESLLSAMRAVDTPKSAAAAEEEEQEDFDFEDDVLDEVEEEEEDEEEEEEDEEEEEEEEGGPLGFPRLPAVGAPLREWLAAVQEFVSLAHSFFLAAQSVIEIIEEALTRLQLHRLLQGYNRMLRAGSLATLGVVSPGPPPEAAGPPSVACAQQGMTCCVPLAAAAGWQQRPLYLNGSNRGDCRASFVSRANKLCASTPFLASPCNIKLTDKHSPLFTTSSSSSSGGSGEGGSWGDGLFKVYTAVLPLPGYAAAAVCQCEVSVHPDEDGLHTLQGWAAWDLEGGPSTDIMAETQHQWGYLKAFVRTGGEVTDILRHLADPGASTLQRIAQVLTLVSKAGGGGPPGPPATAPSPSGPEAAAPPYAAGGPPGGPSYEDPSQSLSRDPNMWGGAPSSTGQLHAAAATNWLDTQQGPPLPPPPEAFLQGGATAGAPPAFQPGVGVPGGPLLPAGGGPVGPLPPMDELHVVGGPWGPDNLAAVSQPLQMPVQVRSPGGPPSFYEGGPWVGGPAGELRGQEEPAAPAAAAAAAQQGWRARPPYH